MQFRVIILGALMSLLWVIGIFSYHYASFVFNHIHSLESQIEILQKAFQTATIVNEETKQQVKILADKNAEVRSQDEILTSVVARATPAVVSIVGSKDVPLLQIQYVNPFGNDPAYRDVGLRTPVFRQIGTQEKQISAGTGFFVRSNGYIVTNRHVVADEQAGYAVLLSSGAKKDAQVVLRDKEHDLAILKIDGNGYRTIPVGDMLSAKLGQTVVAIGNALGEYNNSVSVGIISGLGRTIEAEDSKGNKEKLSGVIQTDTAINHGNSGGPLLDLSGNAIGLNVAMSEGANSIAFAIPANIVMSFIDRVIPAR